MIQVHPLGFHMGDEAVGEDDVERCPVAYKTIDPLALFRTVGPLDGPVAVVGSINADLTVRVASMPLAGETIAGGAIEVRPGGKSSNQAAAAALLGAPTALVGAVGRDENGRLLGERLAEAGVDVTHVREVSSPTSSAIILVDDRGENLIIVTAGANDDVLPSYVEDARRTIAEAKTLGLALEVPAETVLKAAKLARDGGTLTIFNPSPMPDSVSPLLLALTDVLIVNEGELAQLVGNTREDWVEAIGRLRGLGVRRAVVTLGPRGSVVLDDSITLVPAIDVDVVDTTGCGDSFTGALLSVLAVQDDLVLAASFASVVSSYASAGAGAQSSYGDRRTIEAFFT